MKKFHQGLIHIPLVLYSLFLLLPLYLAFVAASHESAALTQATLPVWPGKALFHNFYHLWTSPVSALGGVSLPRLLWNSFCMAFLIAFFKILFALCSAFGYVYYDFKGKQFLWMLILMTLMLPIDIRFIPTFEVVIFLHGMNTLWGLTMPLMVSATATIFFHTALRRIPQHMMDAAYLDGVHSIRFFFDMLIPLMKSPICGLFVIVFIYGWNQYLWPLIMINQPESNTMILGVRYLSATTDLVPEWNTVMCMTFISLLPPCLVLLFMQKDFESGIR